MAEEKGFKPGELVLFDGLASPTGATVAHFTLEQQALIEEHKRQPIWNVLAERRTKENDREPIRRVGRVVRKMSSVPKTWAECTGLVALGEMGNNGALEPYVHTIILHDLALARCSEWATQVWQASQPQNQAVVA